MACSRLALPLLAAAALPCSSLRTDANVSAYVGPIRHLFVAGTVGTGLEFFQQIMKECVENEVCETRRPDFYTSVKYQQDSEEELRKAWVRERPTTGRLVPMNLVSPNEDRFPDELFLHPFSGQAQQGNQNPNLPLYEKVADSIGDSFKVLVLTRASAEDLLAAVMRLTKKGAEEAEVQEADNIRALSAQLRELPKTTYRCQTFEDLASYGPHMHRMLNLEQQEGNDAVDAAVKVADHVGHGCGKAQKKVSKSKKCPSEAPFLRRALDELESLCRPSDVGARGVNLNELPQSAETYASKIQWMMG
uniref:Uncharacterized protein n=1 Tax=Alexandrium catenella TaxID=2925 RepID=A0A7S1R5G1_ALECA